jgi:hypothetical protein
VPIGGGHFVFPFAQRVVKVITLVVAGTAFFAPCDHLDAPKIAAAVLRAALGTGGSIIHRHALSRALQAEKRDSGHLDISDRHALQS